MDTLGKVPVAVHSADVKVLIGNQVGRRDQRVCLLAGKVFTLPLHFQISFCQCLAGFFAVLAPFLFPRELSMQSLELLFRFAIVTRIVNPVPFRVGQEGCESDINANCCARWHMLHLALSPDAQLAIVAIGTLDKAHSLDLLEREGGDCLFLIANQAKTANPTPISESDMFAINRELPASGFVLDTSIVVLELRIAFLPRLLVFAVLVEPRDSEPRSISTGLTSLGIERGGKRVLTGYDRTIHLKAML